MRRVMDKAVIPRVLAVDAGNTRTKWGVHDGHVWSIGAPMPTSSLGDANAFRELPRDIGFDQIVISNVAGQRVGELIRAALAGFGAPVRFIESKVAQCGVVSRYEPPQALGCDRWAAMIGAYSGSNTFAPTLVVMAGTALTVDALTADGVFLGGVIAPGPALMRAALNRGTAQLPDTAGEYRSFARNTIDAIETGAIDACAGTIERMHAKLAADSNAVPRCVASGGAIRAIARHLPFPVAINDNLVLDGLRKIALDNAAH